MGIVWGVGPAVFTAINVACYINFTHYLTCAHKTGEQSLKHAGKIWPIILLFNCEKELLLLGRLDLAGLIKQEFERERTRKVFNPVRKFLIFGTQPKSSKIPRTDKSPVTKISKINKIYTQKLIIDEEELFSFNQVPSPC